MMSDQFTPRVRLILMAWIIIFVVIFIVRDYSHIKLLSLLIIPIAWIIINLIFTDYWWWKNHIKDREEHLKKMIQR